MTEEDETLQDQFETLERIWNNVNDRIEEGNASDNDAEYLLDIGSDLDDLQRAIEEERREWELDQMIQDWEDTKQSMMGDI
jgi:hypothetical protein|tara:strand:+ start:3319 stop:3561 length:243 start_codon:yes stop_codon:yes gene_type:complete